VNRIACKQKETFTLLPLYHKSSSFTTGKNHRCRFLLPENLLFYATDFSECGILLIVCFYTVFWSKYCVWDELEIKPSLEMNQELNLCLG